MKNASAATCLNLDAVPPALQAQVGRAFEEGNAETFLGRCRDRGLQMQLVADNHQALRHRGIYEECLLRAYVNTKSGFHGWSVSAIGFLLVLADKGRLREAGDPLPDQPNFRVFRGVAGHGVARRLGGYSWTLSLDVACWFATARRLARPAVLLAELTREDVMAFWDRRGEREVVCRPETYHRLRLPFEEMKSRAVRHKQVIAERNLATANRLAVIADLKEDHRARLLAICQRKAAESCQPCLEEPSFQDRRTGRQQVTA